MCVHTHTHIDITDFVKGFKDSKNWRTLLYL